MTPADRIEAHKSSAALPANTLGMMPRPGRFAQSSGALRRLGFSAWRWKRMAQEVWRRPEQEAVRQLSSTRNGKTSWKNVGCEKREMQFGLHTSAPFRLNKAACGARIRAVQGIAS